MEMQAQAKGIYSIFSAQLVLSGVKLQMSWHILLLTSAWLGFSLSHIFVLTKELLTWKWSRRKFPFMFWILYVSKAYSHPGFSEL